MSNIKGSKLKIYPPEFKVMVVEDILENNLSICEAARKYNLFINSDGFKHGGHISGGTISMVSRWKSIYLKEGKDSLMNRRHGKPLVRSSLKTKFNSKEELLKENQRLHAEIDYLKKLDALVQKRMQPKKKSLK